MSQTKTLTTSAYVGLFMVFVYVALGILGPWIAPHSPESQSFEPFLKPSLDHWLGTDAYRNDVLSALLHGARISLLISLSVVFISATMGVFIGVLSGYFGGVVDEIIMRVVDVFMAFPGLLLNITVVATVAKPSVGIIVVALIVNGWVGYARVARGQVLTVREREYVVAAKAIGAHPWRVMTRHIIPNLLSPIIVQMTFAFGTVILVEASLSFLGLGPQKTYTWGALLRQGNDFLVKTDFEYFVLIPGCAIMWVVLGANLLGDGLRDRYDPKLQSR